MLQELWPQFQGGITEIAAVCSVIYLAWTRLSKSVSLYDGHWTRRRHKLLKELRADETAQGPYARYLDEAIYLENYRIVSGVRTNKRKADLLVKLALLGHWNSWQIRQIARYLHVSPEHPEPRLRITGSDVAGAWISLIFAWCLLAVGAVVGVAVMYQGASINAVFLGLFQVLIFTFSAGIVMFGRESYRVACRFQKYLEDHPETLHDDASPSLDSPASPSLEAVTRETKEPTSGRQHVAPKHENSL
ncbi:hypothetical protein [Pseudomonas putida]|uniref:hypothetical protein n=1 Tax=Pseudomonas putida TaxID=303 RepID=UPI0021F8EB92|nr:hypothetical protein [Pseudomonas putida]